MNDAKEVKQVSNGSTGEQDQNQSYEKPEVKTLQQKDVVQAVSKGSKFPARGFAG